MVVDEANDALLPILSRTALYKGCCKGPPKGFYEGSVRVLVFRAFKG